MDSSIVLPQIRANRSQNRASSKAATKDLHTVSEEDALFGMPPMRHQIKALRPVVAEERTHTEEGLWTAKASAVILEGDGRNSDVYCLGEVKLMQLRDLYKLSFTNLRLVWRTPHEERPREDECGNAIKYSREVNVRLFLVKKKAKKRMTDLEEVGLCVRFKQDNGYIFGSEKTMGSFDISLADVFQPGDYKGVILAKPMDEQPITEEPAIFGYAKLVFAAPVVKDSQVILGMASDSDQLKKLEVRANQIGPQAKVGGKHRVQPQSYYYRNAVEAWHKIEKSEEYEINFQEFMDALDQIDILILEPRAMRLFKVCDVAKKGKIGITDFEIGLMINDFLPNYGLTLIDVFLMFDLEGSEKKEQTEDEFSHNHMLDKTAIKVEGFEQILLAMGVDLGVPEVHCHVFNCDMICPFQQSEEFDSKVGTLFHKYDKNKDGTLSYREMRQAWVELCDAEAELKKMDLTPYTGWGKNRVNRLRLSLAVESQEKAILNGFKNVRVTIEDFRKEQRLRRDARRRKKAEKLGGDQATQKRDIALRNKERSRKIKKEQQERAKRRQEEKLLKNKLEIEKAKAKQRRNEEIQRARVKSEADRVSDIRRRGLDKLDCSYQDWKEVPAAFYTPGPSQDRLSDLVWLDFSQNKIEALPESGLFFWLSTLRRLSLKGNRLMYLPQEIENLGRLEILDISQNEIVQIPPEVGKLASLKHLDVAQNQLEMLPSELGLCTNIEFFSAHSNKLVGLPQAFGKLNKLQRLDLRGNRLLELPEDFSFLFSLYKLDLLGNQLRFLPKELGNVCNIHLIDLSSNRVAILPDSLVTFEEMEIFHFRENDLRELGSYLAGWRDVVEIDVSFNKIHTLSSSIGGCKSLQSLNITSNKLTKLPSEIGLAKSLQSLQLRSNQIGHIPVEIGSLTQLHTLDLSNNQIGGTVCQEIGLLVALQELNLSDNKITDLPNSIGGLTELVSFELSRNSLNQIPENMRNLEKLQNLELASNRIESVSYTLANLSGVKSLDLSNNLIHHIPENMTGWSRLETLDLTRNFLRALPVDFASIVDNVSVMLAKNPINDLPNKWNGSYSQSAVYETPFGYSNMEIMEWVRDQEKFYYHCVEEWKETGAMHFAGKATLDAFTKAVRGRCGHTWEERLRPQVKRFYFMSKERGTVPVYHMLNSEELEKSKQTEEQTKVMRDERFLEAKEKHQARLQRQKQNYGDIKFRLMVLEAKNSENEYRRRLTKETRHLETVEFVTQQKKSLEKKLQGEPRRTENSRQEEMKRLKSYLKDTMLAQTKQRK